MKLQKDTKHGSSVRLTKYVPAFCMVCTGCFNKCSLILNLSFEAMRDLVISEMLVFPDFAETRTTRHSKNKNVA